MTEHTFKSRLVLIGMLICATHLVVDEELRVKVHTDLGYPAKCYTAPFNC